MSGNRLRGDSRPAEPTVTPAFEAARAGAVALSSGSRTPAGMTVAAKPSRRSKPPTNSVNASNRTPYRPVNNSTLLL
jgi:hypothetical protein